MLKNIFKNCARLTNVIFFLHKNWADYIVTTEKILARLRVP